MSMQKVRYLQKWSMQ